MTVQQTHCRWQRLPCLVCGVTHRSVGHDSSICVMNSSHTCAHAHAHTCTYSHSRTPTRTHTCSVCCSSGNGGAASQASEGGGRVGGHQFSRDCSVPVGEFRGGVSQKDRQLSFRILNYRMHFTATHCSKLQPTASRCITLQHTAKHYNTLQQDCQLACRI